MKKIIVFLLFLISFAATAQKNTIKIDKTDTLKLGQFESEKIVRYSINNVMICISAKDYLIGIKEYHKTYKSAIKINKKHSKWVNDPSIFKADDEIDKRRFTVIDSVLRAVKSKSKKVDTIDISQQIFDKIGLGSLIDFDQFIENGKCAIFDEQGIRQFIIVKNTVTKYYGKRANAGGRQYYLINHKKHFYEDRDWVS